MIGTRHFLPAVLASLFLTAALFCGCRGLELEASAGEAVTGEENVSGDEDSSADDSRYCSFRLSLTAPDARTAMIPCYAITDYYYTLSFSDAYSQLAQAYPAESGSAASYSDLMAASFTLVTGNYTCSLQAWKDASCSVLILCAEEAITLTAETSGIVLTLTEPAAGSAGLATGSVSVPVTFPLSAGIASVTASLASLATPGTALDSQSLTPAPASDASLGMVTYEKAGLAPGAYILTLALTTTDASGESFSVSLPYLVKVASGVVSLPDSGTGRIALSSVDVHERYALSYENTADGDGNSFWVDGASVPLSFVENQLVSLPLPTLLSRSGLFFAGWYESADFSGSPIESFTGAPQAKTVYARWSSPALYVSETGSDSSGDGLTLESAFASLGAALEKQFAITSGQSEAAAYDWTVYVSGKVQGNTALLASGAITSIAANSFLITGLTGSSQDKLVGDGSSAVFRLAIPAALSLSNLTLTGGAYAMGGGIYVGNDEATLTLGEGLVVTGNENSNASYGGGGVAVNKGLVICDGALIQGNTASGNGGGVYIFNGEFQLKSGSIGGSESGEANTAVTNGGGVIVAPNGSFIQTGGSICGNSAVSGGGIYVSGSYRLIDGSICDNTASASGGGIYSAGSCSIEGGSISTNTANAGGGLINAENCTLTISGGSLSANGATSGGGIYNGGTLVMSGGSVTGNTASSIGGGIYSESAVYLYGDATVGTPGDTTAGSAAGEHGNSASYGGGLYLKYQSASSQPALYLGLKPEADGSLSEAELTGGIYRNYATGAGGGIYLLSQNSSNAAVMEMHSGTVAGNKAEAWGGGLYAVDKATIVFSGGSIVNNEASNGGAVAVRKVTYSPQIQMGGAVSMPAGDELSNDFYLDTANGLTIALTGKFTAEAPVLTLTPSAYTENAPVLTDASGAAESSVAFNAGKCAVKADADGDSWAINESGLLVHGSYGSKSAPDSLGDFVFADGTASPQGSSLTSSQLAAAIAVVFYAGSEDDALGQKILAVGLEASDTGLAWALSGTQGESTLVPAIQCSPSNSSYSTDRSFSGDIDGSDNWEALQAACSDTATSGNYPAWEWAAGYGSLSASNAAGSAYESGWYLPSLAELNELYKNSDAINALLSAAGFPELGTVYLRSSSQDSEGRGYVCHPSTGYITSYANTVVSTYVRAVRAF